MITIFNLLGGFGGSSNQINDVLFTTKIIYRNNVAIELDAYPVGNVNITSHRWEIRRMSDNALVGLSLNANASIDTVTTPGYYKISYKGKTVTDQYVRQWDDVVVWYPEFTEQEADDVYDLASGNIYHDYASANNTGRKIYIKGTGTGYVALLNLWGTTGGFQNYVRVQREHNEVHTGVSGSDMISFGGARYVFIDGYNTDGTPGWEAHNPTGGLFEFRCENILGGVTNLHVGGLKLIRDGASNDRASISIIPPVNSTYNATNWVYDKMAIHGCSITNSGAEGIYVMYTNDTPQSTYIPPKARDMIIAWNTVTNSGNDAIQNASCVGSTRVHDNTIDTWGIQGSSGHEAAFSWNEGNSGLCYNNYAINGKMAISAKSGLTPWDIQAGQTTPQRVAFYNNVFIEGTPPAVGGTEPVFSYFQANNTGNSADWPVQIFNNTFLCNKLGITFAFNSAGGFTIPTLKLFNNIFVKTGGSNEYSYTGAGTYPSSPVINNIVRSFSSYSDLLFTSSANLRPSSLTSPVFTGATDTDTYISGIDFNDADGFPSYDGAAYTHGAYTRDDLKTITPTVDDAAAASFTVAPAVGSLTYSGGTITFQANKPGLLYYVVVSNGDSTPTNDQIIAGLNAAGSTALNSGEIFDAGTGSGGSEVFTDRNESTAYDMHCIFVTRDNIRQAASTKVDFTTAADTTPPVLSGWEVRNANPNRLYFNSSKVITGTTYGGFTIDQILGTTITVTGLTVNSGQLTDHYFSLSGNLLAIDYLARIAYSGSGSNIQDTASTPNALASFAATVITNSITYSKRINVNITSFGQNLVSSTAWNNADLATAGVQTIISNLDDINNTPTGYAFEIANAFHALNNSVNATAGTYISEANALVRGAESYSSGDAAGTFRFSGLTSGKSFDLIYLIKNTFGTGAGNINVNGAGAVGYTTGTKEGKVSGTVNGSGYIDVVMTQTTSNTSECMVAIILVVYP